MLGPEPLRSSGSSAPMGPAGLPTHPTPTLRPCVLPGSSPGFPEQSQLSDSIKPFIPSAVTQEQAELVPLRRDPNEGIPWFYPLTVCMPKARVWLFLPGPQLLLGLSVSLRQRCHHSWCPLLCFVGRSRALVSGSHLELNLHLALQMAQPPAPGVFTARRGESGSEVVSVLSLLPGLMLCWELLSKQSNRPPVESGLPMMATGEGCPRLYVSSSVIVFLLSS